MKHCGCRNCGSPWFPICNADDINSYIDHDDYNKDDGSYMFALIWRVLANTCWGPVAIHEDTHSSRKGLALKICRWRSLNNCTWNLTKTNCTK